jgi:Kef-type K+ transport system membrane component KefB
LIAPTTFILELSILLFAALLAGMLVKRAGYPAALGEMLVGIVVGPFALGLVQYSEFLILFSELGAIILLFYIGLETDLDALRRSLLPSLSVGTAGAVLPLGLGYWSATVLGMNQTESLFIGAILMATSIGISVRLLRDIGKINSTEGVIILGAGIVDDIVAIIFLSIVLDIANGSFEILDTVLITVRAVVFWFALVILGVKFFPKILGNLTLKHEELSLTLLALAFLFPIPQTSSGYQL